MTILFKRDWRFYPNAIVDTKTRNRSFLEMADRYRQMGIDHYYFMLALHNPALQGVDPYDPSLSLETKLDIAMECRSNLWYFIREVARLPGIGSSEPIAFRANRGNIAALWLFMIHVTFLLVQPRQTGKSGSIDCLTIWLMDIGSTHLKMLMITKDNVLQTDAISRLKAIRELLPKYLYTRHKNDSDNKTGIDNTELANEYKTGVARSNIQAANNLGRGVTVPAVHIDEVPFITHIGVTMPAALKAGNMARRMAERNGSPWGTILTTTAGRRDDRDGKYVYENIVAPAMIWNEKLFDATDRLEALKIIDRGCTGKMQVVDVTMNHRQLGYTDKWLYESVRSSGGTKEENERDLLNIWNSGSARSPLTAELNTIIRESAVDPVWTEVSPEDFLVRWYVDKNAVDDPSRKLILGLDSSEGIGRDAIAGILTDVSSLAVVGAFTVNLANIIEFSQWMARFMIAHPNVTLIPERKSTGQTIVDTLLMVLPRHNVDPFKRIFNTIIDEMHESPEKEEAALALDGPIAYRDNFFYTERKSAFGFATNGPRRDLLYGNIFQTAARQSGSLIRDKKLVDEITGLSIRNNRIDHSTSGHDDHVISWCLTHWFANMAMNLSHYGIEPGTALAEATRRDEANVSFKDRWQSARQNAISEEVDLIVETLGKSDNVALNTLYERKLQKLSRQMESTALAKQYSMDALSARIKEERSKYSHLAGYGPGADTVSQRLTDFQAQADEYRQVLYRHPTSRR